MFSSITTTPDFHLTANSTATSTTWTLMEKAAAGAERRRQPSKIHRDRTNDVLTSPRGKPIIVGVSPSTGADSNGIKTSFRSQLEAKLFVCRMTFTYSRSGTSKVQVS